MKKGNSDRVESKLRVKHTVVNLKMYRSWLHGSLDQLKSWVHPLYLFAQGKSFWMRRPMSPMKMVGDYQMPGKNRTEEDVRVYDLIPQDFSIARNEQ